MNGTTTSTFDPNSPTTRAMFVTILWRLEGEPDFEDILMYANFHDVVQMSYYEKAVGWASKSGIVHGIGEGFFGPDMSITREQLVTMLFRYEQSKGNIAMTTQTMLGQYTDSNDISEYAVSAMEWAVKEGIITGMTDTILAPQGQATRAQISVMLMRYLNSPTE